MNTLWRASIASLCVASGGAAAEPPPYPIEEVRRPITLPAGLPELSINPHGELRVRLGATTGWESATILRVRYGITDRVQVGATYVLEGAYHDPLSPAHDLAIHPGKALGLDVTAAIRRWVAVEAGVPIYREPAAVALQLGVPIKLTFGDKLAIGGLDDVLEITLRRFPPSFDQEGENALAAANDSRHAAQSRGNVRVAIYAMYQQAQRLALVSRLGVAADDFATERTFIRAGIDWTPLHWVDLAFSVGLDDLRHAGSFGPAGYAAVRL